VQIEPRAEGGERWLEARHTGAPVWRLFLSPDDHRLHLADGAGERPLSLVEAARLVGADHDARLFAWLAEEGRRGAAMDPTGAVADELAQLLRWPHT
jgi:hypothetical protein